MRLLFVVNIPRFFVSHRLPLALAAREAGYDVHVATAAGDERNLGIIEEHGLTLHQIPLEQHGMRPLSELRTLIALVRVMRRLRPDLVHLVTIKPVLYGGIAARITRRRAVVAAMSGLGRAFLDDAGQRTHPSRWLTIALRLATRWPGTHVLVQNEDDLRILQEIAVARAGRSSVIPGSGVDLDEFSPSPPPSSGTSDVRLLYAGRLMRQKGLGEFLEVAKRLKGQARFVVAGYSEPGSPDGIQVETMDTLASDGIIEWLGSRSDMPAVIAGSDVVVLPSYAEGFPKTLIEAASSGRPIIATDAPGCRDVCHHEVNGLLVRPADVESLERAVLQLVAQPELRERLGASGREIAVGNFGLESILRATLDLYRALTQRPH